MTQNKERTHPDAKQQTFYWPLNKYERLIVWSVWLFFVIIPFNHVRVLSSHYYSALFSGNFDDGLPWLQRPRDVTDAEWSSLRQLGPFYAIACTTHSLLLRGIVMMSLEKYIKEISIAFTLISLSTLFDKVDLWILITHLFVAYIIINFKSRLLSWTWVLVVLYGIHFHPAVTIWWRKGPVDDSKNLLYYSLLACYLRVLSYGSEYCINEEQIKKKTAKCTGNDDTANPNSFGIVAYFSYLLYVPLFLNGPVLTYDKYKQNGCLPELRPRLRVILKKVASFIVYAFLVDTAFHFLYSSSISSEYNVLERLNCIQTASVIWIELQFFYFKYLALYGIPSLFLVLDGLEDPGQPICITSLCTFGDMWRYFDKGLYAFLKKYIYIPIGGSRSGILTQLLASGCCFAFVSFWHGLDLNYHVIWGITNWLGICSESIAGRMYTSYCLYLQRYPVTRRRIVAFLGGINVGLLVITNVIFLDGFEATKIYCYTLFIRGFPYCPLALAAILYCGGETILDCKMMRKKLV